MKLPTEEECLGKAWHLAIDVFPEKTISKEEADAHNKFRNTYCGKMTEFLSEGEILPKEFIFHEEKLLELIKFCQGK